jgi:hypothetical protein
MANNVPSVGDVFRLARVFATAKTVTGEKCAEGRARCSYALLDEEWDNFSMHLFLFLAAKLVELYYIFLILVV